MPARSNPRVAAIDHALSVLRLERDGGFGIPPTESPERREQIAREIERLARERRDAQQQLEVPVSRAQARAIREAYATKFQALAARLKESQSERYPEAYRREQAIAIRQEIRALEASRSSDLAAWARTQQAEVARLRASDPTGDAASETRRLREQMEVRELADANSTRAQARNTLLPEAWRLLNAGNLDRAAIHEQAARRSGAVDPMLSHEIARLRQATTPHLKQAREIEVMVADEMELAQRDAARLRVTHEVGTREEQVRSSTAVKMADWKRQREAEVLKQTEGIDLPADA